MKEKEKKKQKRREQIERGEPRTKPSKKEMKKNKMSDSQCKVRVAIDSSFDDFMSERVRCNSAASCKKLWYCNFEY